MLITKTVTMKWNSQNKKWYESKGYIYTKWLGEFEVKVEDLPNGSHTLVNVQCDGCGELLKDMKWQNYLKHVHEDGKYYCRICAIVLFSGSKQRITKLLKSISFYQWCYNNLSKELADYILERWDYELNIDKNGKSISPKDVSYASSGFNHKGYWFKCLDHLEHGSELKSISNYTKGQKGSLNCDMCNTISITHSELIKYLANKEDAYKHSMGSHENILMKCPDCGHEKRMRIPNLIVDGFSCNRCGDGISFPEKVVFNMFQQLLDKNFITQLSKTTFEWCKKYRYDFYIEKLKGIICECHGLQHYEEIRGKWGSLKEIKENDVDKEWLARENGIENYIIIDCRKSELKWIKNNIMNSKLPKLLGFKEKDVDWVKCVEYACTSLVRVACDLWKGGINDTLEISKIIKVSRVTAVKYLKQGFELGWCDYYNPNKQKVICLTTNEIFNSHVEASIKYNLAGGSCITACCKHKRNYTGKHPITKEKLVWQYYSEYLQLQELKTSTPEELSIKDNSFSITLK